LVRLGFCSFALCGLAKENQELAKENQELSIKAKHIVKRVHLRDFHA